ncbi:uncharacterized protein Dwil_GK11277 [Drosophila willistoni]|uniref:Uncharacterized protein n=1 Tax=Drosophila willistoni TaxID=7260 RepID=B4NB06_DROWI|nr:uncharacterized protein LOC6647827 [Drosophila willistoni]EDW80970.1 uncharacterized protein Dwil_GK11277 [Drosophila willistoni]
MEKNQKCEETVGQSLSSSSRRVMWKQNDEEETYDSLVNCRRSPVPGLCVTVQPKTSSNSSAQHEEVSTSFPKRSANENWLHIMKEMRRKMATQGNVAMSSPQTSATSLPEDRVATYWQHLFGNIIEKQLDNSKDQEGHSSLDKPNLGLRYKPSHESLQRCADHQAGSKQMMTDFKMESCSLPPQQSCVVREVAPKFAQRMPTSVQNDTDSCCSGDLEGPKNSPVVKLSNASNSVSHSHPAQQQQQRFRTEVISVHVSSPSCDSSVANRRTIQFGSKRRSNSKVTTTGNATSSTSSTPALCNKPSTGASQALNGNTGFPTFRQRQQELHRYRLQIEQRRLDLLELKIAREREDAIHNEILFHKDLQIKENQIKAYEDNDCSNA